MIRSKKEEIKFLKKQRRKMIWFKISGKLKFMRNIIRKKLYQLEFETNKVVTELPIEPIDFKKLSDQQIEYGLTLFLQNHEILKFDKTKVLNRDVYLLVIPTENQLQQRISSAKLLEEIELNTKHNEKPKDIQQKTIQSTNNQIDGQIELAETTSANDEEDNEETLIF